jgi:hypothetical protein
MSLLIKEVLMKYSLASGVKRQQIKYKKLIVAVFASASMAGGMAVPAFAAPGNDTLPPPGQAQAEAVGAQCGTGAASGAFGAYAHGYIPDNYQTPRGADGTQTGLNNSGVCGNRQDNL